MKKIPFLFLLCYLISFAIQAQIPTKEWDKLGQEIAKALNAHDQSVDQYFDKTAFLNRFILQNPRNKDIKQFNRKIRHEWRSFSLGRTLASQPIQYKYEYIRIHEDSSLVIRQWHEESGVNYFLFKLQYINGQWIAMDVYVLLTGQFLSETMKNTIYLPTAIRLIQGGEESRRGMSNAEIYIEATYLLRKQEYQQAYTKISGIPLDERLKGHQILKLNLSYLLESNEKILKTIEEYQKLFPNDPSFEFIMLDKYVLEETYEKALTAVQVIEDFIGEDDYLYYQKGVIYEQLEDFKEAEVQIRKAIAKRPNEALYYWELLSILEWQEDYKGCVKTLKQMQKVLPHTKEALVETVRQFYYVFPYEKEFERWAK
ncbi:hypothetical protein [Aureispira sp. CCB-E]|uniref:tetratricopeptide repeat protein n=1 Tax=Aureispira sp. CCB-E TaxID=3051121 RepID=UPI002868B903|nr:hypothetical protein [Aureispira sp. CCB-E]WMX14872.1 hypothetical protein QP953_00640 [Aureispira sp. CCB-E]